MLTWVMFRIRCDLEPAGVSLVVVFGHWDIFAAVRAAQFLVLDLGIVDDEGFPAFWALELQ